MNNYIGMPNQNGVDSGKLWTKEDDIGSDGEEYSDEDFNAPYKTGESEIFTYGAGPEL